METKVKTPAAKKVASNTPVPPTAKKAAAPAKAAKPAAKQATPPAKSAKQATPPAPSKKPVSPAKKAAPSKKAAPGKVTKPGKPATKPVATARKKQKIADTLPAKKATEVPVKPMPKTLPKSFESTEAMKEHALNLMYKFYGVKSADEFLQKYNPEVEFDGVIRRDFKKAMARTNASTYVAMFKRFGYEVKGAKKEIQRVTTVAWKVLS